MNKILDTELILNADGSVYHLNLLPQDIGNTIFTVGDPDRAELVASFFDEVTIRKSNREFKTITGSLNSKKVSVISTGIGTDNIDIVLNELDALVNVDLDERVPKQKLTSLNIIRIGTSGAMQKDIDVDSVLVSEFGLGIGVLGSFYGDDEPSELLNQIKTYFSGSIKASLPIYGTYADAHLLAHVPASMLKGITLTCQGFYAPQGRSIRLSSSIGNFVPALSRFSAGERRFTNFEMETSGIYLLARHLGHKAISFNALLANRITGEFSNQPQKTIATLVEYVVKEYSTKLG